MSDRTPIVLGRLQQEDSTLIELQKSRPLKSNLMIVARLGPTNQLVKLSERRLTQDRSNSSSTSLVEETSIEYLTLKKTIYPIYLSTWNIRNLRGAKHAMKRANL